MSQLTTPVKPKSQSDSGKAARVIDEVDVPMSDGNFYPTKLVSGSGRSKRGPKLLPTYRVRVPSGQIITINQSDYDEAIHQIVVAESAAPAAAPVAAPAPAPAPAPVSPPAPRVDYKDMNVDQLSEFIFQSEDKALLDEIEEWERDNKGRKTVMRALADREAELG